jgi:hypothetical protein
MLGDMTSCLDCGIVGSDTVHVVICLISTLKMEAVRCGELLSTYIHTYSRRFTVTAGRNSNPDTFAILS